MTEEKRTFSHTPAYEPAQEPSPISALESQPVMDLDAADEQPTDDEARTRANHFAEPAAGIAVDADTWAPNGMPGPAHTANPEAAHFAEPVSDERADAFEPDAEPSAPVAAAAQANGPAATPVPAPASDNPALAQAAHFAGTADAPDAAATATAPAPAAGDPLFSDLTAYGADDAPAHNGTDTPVPEPQPGEAPAASADYLGNQDTGELPPLDTLEAVAKAAQAASPADTAEIDVAAVEAKLSDPGTTQSFAPITDDRIATDSTYDAGTTTSIMWGARSDVGCVRSHNEDSYLVASPLFAVCDGMGGHAAGEVASSIAVETIAKMSPGTADPAQLAAAVEAANAAVIEAAAKGIGRPGMGCTATVAYLEGNTIAIAHVGDSRAYLLHDGVLTRITRDHSYVEELVDAGEITADEARVHPNRSVITRALGSDPAMYADHFQLNIEEGDRLILCSDGLSSMIPDSEIESIATKSSTAQICTDNLVDAALAAGGADNVSVIVVDVVDDGRLKQVIRTHRRNLFIAIGLLVTAVAVAIGVLWFTIANAVYLGVEGETVALYRGIPSSVFGVELHHVEESTSIKLSDLPEDTQNRLSAGIPQDSLEQAWETLSDYRRQIDEAQTQQKENAEAIRESAEAAQADQAQADQQAQANGENPQADTGAGQQAASPDASAPSPDPAAQTQEGGA